MTEISIFVPAYNEEIILEKNIIKIYNKLNELGYDFELFIVDDSSTDSTPSVGSNLAKEHEKIMFVRHEIGPSSRENLSKSFNLAKGDIIIFMDADLSTNLKHTKELVDTVRKGYDIVTGSRHIKGTVVHRNLSRRIISNLYKYFAKIYFNSKVNDHECGFKAFKKEVILHLVNEMGYDKKFKRKMFWDTEMFVRAQREDYKIKEIPITWKAGEKSSIRFFKEMSMIPYMLRLKSKL